MKKIMVILIGFFIFSSCATFEYNKRRKAESILIGNVTVEFLDTVISHGNRFQGTIKNNIEIYLKHTQSTKSWILQTTIDGYYQLIDPIPGEYMIEEIRFYKKGGGFIVTVPLKIGAFFKIASGPDVHSLGELKILLQENKCGLEYESGITQVRKNFSNIYPKSEWIDTLWNECFLY